MENLLSIERLNELCKAKLRERLDVVIKYVDENLTSEEGYQVILNQVLIFLQGDEIEKFREFRDSVLGGKKNGKIIRRKPGARRFD